MQTCQNRELDWRGLRLALGLTQADFAHLLGVETRTVGYHEQNTNRATSPLLLATLRRVMKRDRWRALLEASAYQYPFSEDWKDQ